MPTLSTYFILAIAQVMYNSGQNSIWNFSRIMKGEELAYSEILLSKMIMPDGKFNSLGRALRALASSSRGAA